MYGLGGGQMVNGVYVMDTPITTDTVLPSGENVYTDSTGAVIAAGAGGSSLSSMLNGNAGLLALGAGALLLLVGISKR